jgi:hypothetical protein
MTVVRRSVAVLEEGEVWYCPETNTFAVLRGEGVTPLPHPPLRPVDIAALSSVQCATWWQVADVTTTDGRALVAFPGRELEADVAATMHAALSDLFGIVLPFGTVVFDARKQDGTSALVVHAGDPVLLAFCTAVIRRSWGWDETKPMSVRCRVPPSHDWERFTVSLEVVDRRWTGVVTD